MLSIIIIIALTLRASAAWSGMFVQSDYDADRYAYIMKPGAGAHSGEDDLVELLPYYVTGSQDEYIEGRVTLVLQNYLCMFGGLDRNISAPSNMNTMIDLLHNTSMVTSLLQVPIAGHSGVVVQEVALMCGGVTGSNNIQYVPSCMCYEAGTSTKGKPAMLISSDFAACTSQLPLTSQASTVTGIAYGAMAMSSNTIYYIGGELQSCSHACILKPMDNVYMLDTRDPHAKWQWFNDSDNTLPEMKNHGALGLDFIAAHSGSVLICGGYWGGATTLTNQCGIFNPAYAFNITAPMLVERASPNLVPCSSDSICIIGGYNDTNDLVREIEEYRIESRPTPDHNHTSSRIIGYLPASQFELRQPNVVDIPAIATKVVKHRMSTWMILVITLSAVLVLVFLLAFLRTKIKNDKLQKLVRIQSVPVFRNANEYAPAPDQAAADDWEISRSALAVDEYGFLGSGAFCNVYTANFSCSDQEECQRRKLPVQATTHRVAVKLLYEHTNDVYHREDFLKEIEFMKTLGHHVHIVNLIGCITRDLPLMLVIQFCDKGSLLSLVRALGDYNKRQADCNSAPPVIDENDFPSVAWQIADGLNYLASLHIIHRDVAARNVLITGNKVAKISDFGLCRLPELSIYTSQGGKLPVRWMAIESLSRSETSTKSDVWAYGVLLWEMYSYGEIPYGSMDPMDILPWIRLGKRLAQPVLMSLEMYNGLLLERCWCEFPQARADFEELKSYWRRAIESLVNSDCYLVGYAEIC